jgi:hypothetical protein
MSESLCSGCGAVAPGGGEHPFIGVARDQESGLMTAYPICVECWRDPAHRQRTLKMHFFDRSQANEAVTAAESNILVEKPDDGRR